MTYTGSSCDYIYNKYPEIYKNNPKEKSGYYRLSNNQWTYCNMTEIAANDTDFTSTRPRPVVGVIKSTYQSFLPGEFCESIYNNNPESHEWSGYYWITSSREYCGMNYTGSSCEGIYNNNPETSDKSGYYCINDTQWTYCNISTFTISGDFISTILHVLVGEEDGGELLMLTSVQEMIVRVSGVRPHNLVLASLEWPGMINMFVLLPISLLTE